MGFKITHERLLKVLDYDPVTGIFSWKVRPSNKVKIGDRAGALGSLGYRFISVDGEKLQASRTAWFYVYGEWPKGEIKFDDDNTDNCSIKNLKDISKINSSRLRGALSNNTSGFKGVSRSKSTGGWQTNITWNYKQINLGSRYKTAEEAADVYNDAELRLREAMSIEDGERILKAVILERRQRAIWRNLTRQDLHIGWPSFDAFAIDVIDIPRHRYAIGPIDALKPIGPGNWRWASDHGVPSKVDQVAYNRATRNANREYWNDKYFRKNYGIGIAEYRKMESDQHGVCACCGRAETKIQNGAARMLSVDHDHATGAVRGLLCSSCNQGIGYFYDDADKLRAAIAYLEKHSAPRSESDWHREISAAIERGRKDCRDWLLVHTMPATVHTSIHTSGSA